MFQWSPSPAARLGRAAHTPLAKEPALQMPSQARARSTPAGLTRAKCLAVRTESFVEETLGERVTDELGAALQAQLLHDVRAVGLGRAHRDVEFLRDLLVGVAEREQPEHLALAVGEGVLLGPALSVGIGGDEPRAELGVDVPSAARDLADGG